MCRGKLFGFVRKIANQGILNIELSEKNYQKNLISATTLTFSYRRKIDINQRLLQYKSKMKCVYQLNPGFYNLKIRKYSLHILPHTDKDLLS